MGRQANGRSSIYLGGDGEWARDESPSESAMTDVQTGATLASRDKAKVPRSSEGSSSEHGTAATIQRPGDNWTVELLASALARERRRRAIGEGQHARGLSRGRPTPPSFQGWAKHKLAKATSRASRTPLSAHAPNETPRWERRRSRPTVHQGPSHAPHRTQRGRSARLPHDQPRAHRQDSPRGRAQRSSRTRSTRVAEVDQDGHCRAEPERPRSICSRAHRAAQERRTLGRRPRSGKTATGCSRLRQVTPINPADGLVPTGRGCSRPAGVRDARLPRRPAHRGQRSCFSWAVSDRAHHGHDGMVEPGHGRSIHPTSSTRFGNRSPARSTGCYGRESGAAN